MSKPLILVGIVFFILVGVLAYRYLHEQPFGKELAWFGPKMDKGILVERQSEETLPYRIYSPPKKSLEERYPLIVVLHGASGRGNDNQKQLDYPSVYFTSEKVQKNYPSYVVVPQCPDGLEWNDLAAGPPPYLNYNMSGVQVSWRERAIAQLIDTLSEQYAIHPERIYVVGYSMGASGIWSLLVNKPELFAAAVVINGRGDPAMANHIQAPVWSFHGNKDPIAPVANSEQLIAALHELDKPAKLSVVEGSHNINTLVFDEPVLIWLFSQQKNDISRKP